MKTKATSAKSLTWQDSHLRPTNSSDNTILTQPFLGIEYKMLQGPILRKTLFPRTRAIGEQLYRGFFLAGHKITLMRCCSWHSAHEEDLVAHDQRGHRPRFDPIHCIVV